MYGVCIYIYKICFVILKEFSFYRINKIVYLSSLDISSVRKSICISKICGKFVGEKRIPVTRICYVFFLL